MCDIDLNKFMYDKKEFPLYFPDEIQKAIKLLTLKEDKVVLFGTSSLKSMLYAGDIDLVEKIKIKDQPEALKKIVKKILDNPEYGTKYLIGDIKAGRRSFGRKLIESLGKIESNGIVDFNRKKIRKIFKENNIEYGRIPINPDLGEWIKLFDFCHMIETLRWTPEEILKGVHKETGTTLKEACDDSVLTKVDLYAYVGTKYMEITTILSYSFKMSDVIEGIKLSLAHYLFQKKPNYLKSIKRANALSRLTGNCEYMSKVKDFLIGQVALLNSIKTDIDIILTITEKFGYKINDDNKNYLYTHLGSCISRLSNIYNIKIPKKLFELLHEIQNKFESKNPKIYYTKLNECMDIIEKIIDNEAEKFIDENDIDLLQFFN